MGADDAKEETNADSFLNTLRVIAHSEHTPSSPRAPGGRKAAITAHSAHANILDQSKLFDDDDDDDAGSFADEVEESVEEAPPAAAHRSRDSSPVRRSRGSRPSSPARTRSKTESPRSSSPRRTKTLDGSPGKERSGSPQRSRHRRTVTSGSPSGDGGVRSSRRSEPRGKSPVRGGVRDSARGSREGPNMRASEGTTSAPRRTREGPNMRASEGTTTSAPRRTRSSRNRNSRSVSPVRRSDRSHNRSAHTSGSPSSTNRTKSKLRSSDRSPLRPGTISKLYAESANVQKARRKAFMKLCEQDGVTEVDPLRSSHHDQAMSRKQHSPDNRRSREGSPNNGPSSRRTDALRTTQTGSMRGLTCNPKHVLGVKPSDDPLAIDYDKQLEATIGFKPNAEAWDMMKGGFNF